MGGREARKTLLALAQHHLSRVIRGAQTPPKDAAAVFFSLSFFDFKNKILLLLWPVASALYFGHTMHLFCPQFLPPSY